MGMLLRRHNIPLGNIKQGEEIPLVSVVEEKVNSVPLAEEVKEEKTSTPIYTKTDINRMSTSELKDLAKKNGISGSDDMTGAELKRILIDYYSL